jgi:putative transposase
MNHVLQAQATEQVESDRYERSDDRQGYRNRIYLH